MKLTLSASTPYDVLIDPGLIHRAGEEIAARIPARRVFVATDENVYKLYYPALESSLRAAGFSLYRYVMLKGEENKNHQTLIALYEAMARAGMERGDALLALGGGVVGDVAGFAAATYMRGIDWVLLPTTLLSQMDSSLGGKTGVNISAGKNLVGAFAQPRLVLCDADALSTLPSREYRAGLGEVIKCAAIADEDLFYNLESLPTEALVYRCCNIKKRFVELDERDLGPRRLLNFGHTAGHAIERAAGFSLLHGEAVAVGMCIAARLGASLGVTPHKVIEELEQKLRFHGLPTRADVDPKAVYAQLLHDKKAQSGRVDAVLLTRIGEAVLRPVPTEAFKEVL